MRRSWIYVLAILGIVATSSGFTVERSNPESFRSRNWTTPVLQPHRRASVPNVLSHEIRPADAINILRDSELREFVKRPNKKHSTFSEDPQHMERSGDASGPTNRSRIAEKMTLEPKESMPGYSILTSSKDRTNSDPTFVTSTGNSKSPGSTNVTSQKETRTPESSIAVGTSGIKVKTLRAPISISSKETRSAESTIGTFSQETGNPGSTIAPSSEEMKSSELPRAHTGMEIDHRKTSSDKNTDVEILKNVVLLLIDDSATGQGNYLRHFLDRHKFPVRGFLQNCNSVKIPEIVKFSLGDSLVSGKVDADCRCNRFLRANVGNLLSWARHVKDMTTGVVTTTNFSVPLPLDYESPANLLVKSFEDSDEIGAVHQDIPRFKSESNEMWHLTDSVKQMVRDKRSVPSTSATPNIDIVPRQDAVNGFDGMWNVFDMFSRIRTAFFRILLESLGNMSASEDELGGKRPMASQPSLVGLVAETLREFQSVPNDNGFVLVAAAPENELTDAVDLLHRQFTTKDTLFVISGICSSTNEPVPFVAHGPGATSLHEARTMWDIPVLIKEAMIAACSVKSCKNERPEDSVALPSVELASLHDELPRNRIGRSVTKDAVTKEAVTKETVTKKAVSEGAVTKEAATKENVTKEVATKEAAPKEAAPKEAAPKEAATKEAAPKEAAPKEAAPKEAAPKEAAPKEGATKGAATKEALTKESSTKEAVTEEAVTKEAVNKEALTKESSTKEAATEEAVTKEAVNKEALTKNETITNTTTSAAKPMNVTDTETENDTATSEIARSSGAADIRNDNGASIFGIITSTATILALHSA